MNNVIPILVLFKSTLRLILFISEVIHFEHIVISPVQTGIRTMTDACIEANLFRHLPMYVSSITKYQFDNDRRFDSYFFHQISDIFVSWWMLGEIFVLHKQKVYGYPEKHPCYVNKECRGFQRKVLRIETARFQIECAINFLKRATHGFDSGLSTVLNRMIKNRSNLRKLQTSCCQGCQRFLIAW